MPTLTVTAIPTVTVTVTANTARRIGTRPTGTGLL